MPVAASSKPLSSKAKPTTTIMTKQVAAGIAARHGLAKEQVEAVLNDL